MSKTVTISKNNISVTISAKSAEMTSIKKDGKEVLWQSDPNVWLRQAPTLFPICGALRDDKYIYGGKEYFIKKHGLILNTELEIESVQKDSAVFLYSSNEDTKKQYPFDFELRVTFKITDNTVNIAYEVSNLTDGEMYFSIGSHEGYSCPEGIEEYSIFFEKPENLETYITDGPLLSRNKVKIGEQVLELPLKYDYFDVDSLFFLDIKSRKVTLKNRNTERELSVIFEDADSLVIWTKPGAKYICIEPWSGTPDFVDSDYDFKNKKGIVKLRKGQKCVKEHKIVL